MSELPHFKHDVIHSPSSSAPLAEDGRIRIGAFFDNPATMLRFVIAWQPMTPLAGGSSDQWMTLRNPKKPHQADIWQIAVTVPGTTTVDGISVTGHLDTIVDTLTAERLLFGDQVMTDINERLTAFFNSFEQEGGSMTGMDKLFAELRKAGFLAGKYVKKAG